MSLRIGLTGGIASGKTTVAGLFTELGITVIDADLIARETVFPGSHGLAAIVAAFGQSILTTDGQLDRKSLRKMIFSDPDRKNQLNSILHPRIREAMIQRSTAAPGPYHLLDIPLLVESGWHKHLDRVLVVDCTEEIQLERLMARDDESREQAQRILQNQSSRQQRLALADDIIDNNHTPAALVQQVYALHQRYLQIAYTQTFHHTTSAPLQN